MKIILSRKGFDSACGGIASPILPDGSMVSLPIPEPRPTTSSRRYEEIGSAAGVKVDRLLADLNRGRVRSAGRWQPADRAHLDPDLDRASVPRADGWRPVFGQTAASQSHLGAQEVGVGDVFLFFGWFRRVVLTAGGSYRYEPLAPDLHVCYGWLQASEIVPASEFSRLPAWMAGHPHLPPYSPADHLYFSADRLTFPGLVGAWPGGGIFGRYRPELQLTAEGKSRSWWRLPAWFHPQEYGDRPVLTYHGTLDGNGALKRWLLHPDHVLLDTAKQGQEFVLAADHYPEAGKWLASLFADA